MEKTKIEKHKGLSLKPGWSNDGFYYDKPTNEWNEGINEGYFDCYKGYVVRVPSQNLYVINEEYVEEHPNPNEIIMYSPPTNPSGGMYHPFDKEGNYYNV